MNENGSSLKSSRFFAPGKLMIAGEYAVLGPEGEALAIAINAGIEATICPSHQWQIVHQDLDLSWCEGAHPVPTDLHFAHHTWRTLMEMAPHPLPAQRISTRSVMMTHLPGKPGFGSSASTVVSITAAMLSLFSSSTSAHRLLETALNVHTQAQGQSGSGYDVATICLGGMVRWRPSIFKQSGIAQSASENIAWPDGLYFLVGYSGKSANTRQFIAKLQILRSNAAQYLEAELRQLAAPVHHLVNAFQNQTISEILDAIPACHQTLLNWDQRNNLGIITPEVKQMLQDAQTIKVPAKISGAGGGDSIIALSDDPQRLGELTHLWEQHGFATVPVSLCLNGVSTNCYSTHPLS